MLNEIKEKCKRGNTLSFSACCVDDKLSLCLINKAPRHGDVWGSGDIALICMYVAKYETKEPIFLPVHAVA
jgi:hypothetical protein